MPTRGTYTSGTTVLYDSNVETFLILGRVQYIDAAPNSAACAGAFGSETDDAEEV